MGSSMLLHFIKKNWGVFSITSPTYLVDAIFRTSICHQGAHSGMFYDGIDNFMSYVTSLNSLRSLSQTRVCSGQTCVYKSQT